MSNFVTLPRLLVVLTGVCLLTSDCAQAQAADSLSFHLETDKTRYYRGEEIEITGLTCNEGESTVAIGVCDTCARRSGLEVLQGSEVVAFQQTPPFGGCAHSCTIYEWAPGECRQRYTFSWHQETGGFPWPGNGKQVGSGIYTVVDDDASVRIEILAQGIPIPSLSRIATFLMATLVLLVGLRSTLWWNVEGLRSDG